MSRSPRPRRPAGVSLALLMLPLSAVVLIGMQGILPAAHAAPGVPATAQAPAFQVSYDADSGILPDADCPSWTLAKTPSAGDPTLSTDRLTLSTSPRSFDRSRGEAMFYLQTSPDIAVGDPLVVEARVRFVSGTSFDSSRTPVGILVTTAPSVGASLYIGQDEIFLLSDDLSRGATATVDTDGAFHTYRVEVSGSTVQVFYDGAPTLAGTTFLNSDTHGNVARVLWGDPTGLAHGESEWQLVRHTAMSTESCPSGPLEIALDASGKVNPRSRGVIPVTIPTTSVADGEEIDFDATLIDGSTLRFGPGEASLAHPPMGHIEDADGDGDLDLVVHFKTQATGITCSTTEAELTGETLGPASQEIIGFLEIDPKGCK